MSVAVLSVAMHRDEIPITTPCGADWSEMTPTEARARMCAACNKVVHDLSAMSEREVRAVVGGGPACVRYLYDAHGRVLLGGAPEGATIVPSGALLSKAARSKWLRAAAVAAAAIVFEACGGNDGGYGVNAAARDVGSPDENDAGATPRTPRVPAGAGVGDAAADADRDAESEGDPDSG